MRIAVYGGTGAIGSAIVAEAAGRGHEVTALSRRKPEAQLPAGVTWREGALGDADLLREVAAEHDVVVSAIGPSRVPGESGQPFVDAVQTVVDQLRGARFVMVGGASSLEVAPGVRLIDVPEFPEAYKSEARWGIQTLDLLRSAGPELDWTYLSPAPEIVPGERTGSYVTAGDTVAGPSISYGDYALALVDEIERPAHRRARFTVATD